MPQKLIVSSTSAPAAIGPYAQAVRVGDLVYTSGQVALDPATGNLVEGDVTAQTEQVCENLRAVLNAVDLTLTDVIKTTVFLKDMNDFVAMNEVYARGWGFFTGTDGIQQVDWRHTMPSMPVAGPLSDAAVAEDLKKTGGKAPSGKVEKTEAEWREHLSPEQYHVLREKGTERAFSGKLYNNHADGLYHCAACNAPLFKSDTKFESGSGWPSFWDPVSPDAVKLHEDNSYGMRRVEVTCATCGSHLGHVFPDGPRETTGQRYCINSASLGFTPDGSNVGER